MLHLESISLFQFKNYANRQFQFDKKISGICGKNGVGKTNVLDAIHYLCFTKSYFSKTDSVNVQHGSRGFRIDGHFLRFDVNETAKCILRENNKKEFHLNNIAYEKFSKHIGHYPCVVIAPDDAVLITGGSEERRTFLDALLSQLDADYLTHLIQYNKVLQQRNSFLKAAAESGKLNEDLLHILNQQLCEPSNFIFDKRNKFLVSFLPKVKRLYSEIAKQEESISLFYESNLTTTGIDQLLQSTKSKDLLLQRTTAGVHRDDLVFQLNNQPFKNIASQGQRKSLLFALKLTELEIITEEKKMPPLLLLDDVFEKLDEERISNLLHRVCIENKGQVFITDTNEHRLSTHLQNIKADFDLISL
ncbi:MAG: DNA replication/repair protein RecF [Niabella sp.]|nr:MAG: DNA replication/repair protein RecF [Niabella sp.]